MCMHVHTVSLYKDPTSQKEGTSSESGGIVVVSQGCVQRKNENEWKRKFIHYTRKNR